MTSRHDITNLILLIWTCWYATIIKPSVLIRDLGITYDCNLRFNDYIDGIVKKAFMRTNLLFRAFVSGNVLILTRAYLTYIRPIVEYCTYIWSPHQAYLIDKIERIQRYFTRRVLCRTNFSYMERQSLLKLDLLEIRRIKSDLKMCFEIINGLCDIAPFHYFKFAPSSSVTRGHNIKLISQFAILTVNYIFSQIEMSTIGIPCQLILWMLVHLEFLFVNLIRMIGRVFVGLVGLRRFSWNLFRRYHFIHYLLPMQCFYFSFSVIWNDAKF